MNSIFEQIKYKTNFDQVFKVVVLVLLLFCLFSLVGISNNLSYVVMSIQKGNSVTQTEKSLDEENTETYNKRLLLEISGKIKDINESLSVIETLVTEENINGLQNEVHNLGEIQKQFVELLKLEEVE